MKKFILLICFSLSFSMAYADPWDCMSQEEAKQLVSWLKKNPFVIDYCDCCHDLDHETEGKSTLKARFLYVSKAEIVPCEYDEERVSVKMTYTLLSEHEVDAAGNLKQSNQLTTGETGSELISLNYYFVTKDHTNLRLYLALDSMEYETINCNGLTGYPDPKKYTGSTGKKYQKWAAANANE